MDKLHYIHSRGGRIGGRADTGPQDVDAIVAALAADDRRHLVIHFHGGLVSKQAGLAIAEKLLPVYSPTPGSGGYPLFFVWESGAWETIRNNFTELAESRSSSSFCASSWNTPSREWADRSPAPEAAGRPRESR